MKNNEFEYRWLTDPEVFEVNRESVHSDYDFYANYQEFENQKSGLKQSLNGMWRIAYFKRLDQSIKNFYLPDFDYQSWDYIKISEQLELQGFGKPQYVNTQYPWDGNESIRPPEIPGINPIANYIKYFEINDEIRNQKHVYISFQGQCMFG